MEEEAPDTGLASAAYDQAHGDEYQKEEKELKEFRESHKAKTKV